MIDDVKGSVSRSRLHRPSRFAFDASISVAVAILGAALLPLSGCTVGPDYRTPAPPATETYTPTPLPDQTASAPGASGVPQQFIAGQDIPAQWWTLFHCEPLDALIREALANSPNVAAAQAALRQAAENYRAEVGSAL